LFTKKLTKEYINKLPYNDFVGLINQWNCLPGAYVSLSQWICYSNLNSKSNILEVGCTTGFASREIAKTTKCSGVGIDISEVSVNSAIYNKKIYAPDVNIDYIVSDGYKHKTEQKFSHVIVGGCLQFFEDPNRMMIKLISMLNDGGYVLASPFFVTKPIPKTLISKAEKVFDFTPTTTNYKNTMKLYDKLEIIYEDKRNLKKETKDELNFYCTCTVNRVSEELNIKDKAILKAIYNRLYLIKKTSNDLRPYQNYSVLVLRYEKSVYPNRFVELF